MVTPRHHTQCTIPIDIQAQMAGSVYDIHVTDIRIQRALGLIESSPRFDLDAIAATLNLSASRLRHVFKAQLGLSPGQYIKFLRLERAKNLLGSTFLTVKEITARVGASDVSHFVRDYKSVYGETPSNARIGWAPHGVRASRNSRVYHQFSLPLEVDEEPSSAKPLKNSRFRSTKDAGTV